MIDEILRKEGFSRVFLASSYEEVVRIFRNIKPDCAILDIVLTDGRGMSQEKINSLLKAHNGLSEAYAKGQNHGLGLLIVAGIINAHKGKLDIKSIDCQGLKTTLKLPQTK